VIAAGRWAAASRTPDAARVTVLTSLEGAARKAGPVPKRRACKTSTISAGRTGRHDPVPSCLPLTRQRSPSVSRALRLGLRGRRFSSIANAVSVSTVIGIGGDLAKAGGPPFCRWRHHRCAAAGRRRGPALYFSGDAAGELRTCRNHGLDVRSSMINRPPRAEIVLRRNHQGLVAIAHTMILAADRAAPGPALRAELAAASRSFSNVSPGRAGHVFEGVSWVEEMHASLRILGDGFRNRSSTRRRRLYQRLATMWQETGGCERLDAFFAG